MMAPREKQDDHHQHSQHHHLRALAARAVTDSLRAAAEGSSRGSSDAADDRARRYRDCVRSLEAEKAKMEVFRRELPISVHLVADVIEWVKEELAQHRRTPTPDLFAPPAAPTPPPPPPPPQAKDGGGDDVKAEEDANDDKRSWMSSAQLWSCGGGASHDDSTANTNGAAAAAPRRPSAPQKVSSAFMPATLASLPTMATRSPDDAAAGNGKPAAMRGVPDLSLSSPAAPSATSSAVTDAAGALRQHQHNQQHQAQQQRKARRCWSPELHRRFVAALQRLGGAQVATPKQIRELMKVDGLTNDEVKSHLQKYRLHTRRATSSDGGVGCGGEQLSAAGLWSSSATEQQQYATSQHSTSQSQSGSPQGPLQLTVSSTATTAGDSSCDGDEAEGGKSSESYGGGWEMTMHHHHHRGTKASSS